MTGKQPQYDSPMRGARVQCGAWPELPPFAAVPRIGNGINHGRAFVRKDCA